MDLILATADGRELCIVPYDADIECGGINNFEISIPRSAWDGSYQNNMLMYVPDTEYGGIIGEVQTMTTPEYAYVKGLTWRGLLDKKIISPASGQDYYTISGEANACIRTLLSTFYKDALFQGSSESTGKTITNYQFNRYTSLLDGLIAMLKTINYKPVIKYIQSGTDGYVEVSAEPIVNYKAQIELSEDDEVEINADKITNGVNHLICLGQGELAQRTVVHLYTDENGNLTSTQVMTGRKEIAEVYDYSSAESESELRRYGLERLDEIKSRISFDVQIMDIRENLLIGDIIAGRDYTTGIYVVKPIIQKILKIVGENETIEYKMEE